MVKYYKKTTVGVGVYDNVSVCHKRDGLKRPATEILQGSFPSKDKERHPKGVDKIRRIDRINNEYQEKVVDKKTGEVTRDCKEKLSEHNSSRCSKKKLSS